MEILAVALAVINSKSPVQAMVDPPTEEGRTQTCYWLAILASP